MGQLWLPKIAGASLRPGGAARGEPVGGLNSNATAREGSGDLGESRGRARRVSPQGPDRRGAGGGRRRLGRWERDRPLRRPDLWGARRRRAGLLPRGGGRGAGSWRAGSCSLGTCRGQTARAGGPGPAPSPVGQPPRRGRRSPSRCPSPAVPASVRGASARQVRVGAGGASSAGKGEVPAAPPSLGPEGGPPGLCLREPQLARAHPVAVLAPLGNGSARGGSPFCAGPPSRCGSSLERGRWPAESGWGRRDARHLDSAAARPTFQGTPRCPPRRVDGDCRVGGTPPEGVPRFPALRFSRVASSLG